jgi:hypothetical protein
VTWIDVPAEMGTEVELHDINRDGYAVGIFTTADGAYRALLADKDGGFSDLNDVFVDALDALPGWRFHMASHINAAGNIAGLLVPEGELRVCSSPDVLIVNANLYSQPPSFTVVDRFLNEEAGSIADMNESGDMLVRRCNEGGIWLYRAPYTDPPELIEGPDGSDSFTVGNLNGACQISIKATFTEPVPINRKNTEELSIPRSYLREPDTGFLREVGFGGYWIARLGEGGTVYDSSDGQLEGYDTHDRIHRWTEALGWLPVTPERGRIRAGVSKEPGGMAEVLIEKVGSGSGATVVYREGYGAYQLNVISGLGQGALDRWHVSPAPVFEFFAGISRREAATSAGFVCGYRGSSNREVFILTPLAPEE